MAGRLAGRLLEEHATSAARVRIEPRPDLHRAEALDDTLHESGVRAADQVAVVARDSIERAVMQRDGLAVGDGFVPERPERIGDGRQAILDTHPATHVPPCPTADLATHRLGGLVERGRALAAFERGGEQAGQEVLSALGERHVELDGRAPVQLRGSAGTRSGPTGQAAVLGRQQSGFDEAVEVECGQGAPDAECPSRRVPADRIGRAGDVEVEGAPDRLGEWREGIETVWEGLTVHRLDSIASRR